MNKLRKKLRSIWLIIKNRLWGIPVPLETIHLDELPDKLKKGVVYLIGENGYLWSAALLCPCGCEAVIQLNLLHGAKPCWRVDEHADLTISLAPSIWGAAAVAEAIISCDRDLSNGTLRNELLGIDRTRL